MTICTTPPFPRAIEYEHLKATQFLLAAGFTCPFLLPSFFSPRILRRAGAGTIKGIVPEKGTRKQASVWGAWKRIDTPNESKLISNAPSELHYGQIASTRFQQSIYSGTNHDQSWKFSLFPSTSLHLSSAFTSMTDISRLQYREFSTIRFDLAPNRKRVAARLSTGRKSSSPSGRNAALKKSVKGQQNTSGATKTPRASAHPEHAGKSRITIQAANAKGSKRQSSCYPEACDMRPSLVTAKSDLSITSDTGQIVAGTVGKRKRPKWIKTGVPRTKVKARGRKARRMARKLVRKQTSTDGDTGESLRDNIVLGFIESSPGLPEPALEIPKSLTWEEIKREATQKTHSSKLLGKKSKPERHMPKNPVKNLPKEDPAPRAGSRISVRGNQIDLTEGRGRKVSGTSTLVPGQRRAFSTIAFNCREKERSDRLLNEEKNHRNVEGEKVTEVNASLPEDSVIPKSQVSETEDPTISNKQQQAEALLPDNPQTEDGDRDGLAKNEKAIEGQDTIINMQNTLESIDRDLAKDSSNSNTSNNSNVSGKEGAHTDPDVESAQAENYVSEGTEGTQAEAGNPPLDENATTGKRANVNSSVLQAPELEILGRTAKLSYPRNLLPFFSARKKPKKCERADRWVTAPPSTYWSWLLRRILKSPHLHDEQIQQPQFWVDICRQWFLPKYVQDKFSSTAKPKIRSPRAADRLFSSEYPPPKLSDERITFGAAPPDIINLIETAKGSNVDLLLEFGRRGEYSAVRWLIRRILHPQIDDIAELEVGGVGDVLGGFSRKAMGSMMDDLHESERISVSRAGDIGLDHLIESALRSNDTISKLKLLHIKIARHGLGLILSFIGNMIVQADPSGFTATLRQSRFFSPSSSYSQSQKDFAASQLPQGALKRNDYTQLLPLSKELLAYLHNCSLIPDDLYSPELHPRLSILQSRILTTLADAVWRHQELVALEAQNQTSHEDGQVMESGGFKAPGTGWKLHGYWRGGFETLMGDSPSNFLGKTSESQGPSVSKKEVMELENMTSRGEREVLLELTLRICVRSGFGVAGTEILQKIVQQGGWSFIDYASTFPEEYRPEDLFLRQESETTNGLPGQWGIRGYSLAPPPVRTQKMTLPQDLIPGMAVSMTDSVAEGKGVVALMSGLDNLGMMFGGEQTAITSKSDSGVLSRVITLWEESQTMDPKHAASGEALLGFIQRWSDADERSRADIAPGEASGELQVWYKVLQGYIDIENIDGAMRVWRELHRRLRILIPENYEPIYSPPSMKEREEGTKQRMEAHYFHPPWILGSFLSLLNQSKQTRFALSLLSPSGHLPFPIIPKHMYHLPPITPPLLALAAAAKDPELANMVIASLPLRIPGAVPHSTLTSVVNMYLRLGNFTSAQEVLEYMKEIGFELDRVDMAVLIENALRRDLQKGYDFVQQTVENDKHLKKTNPPDFPVDMKTKVLSQWGSWSLPAKSAGGPSRDPESRSKFTTFEGQMISIQPCQMNQKRSPKPMMSPSGWISVLDHAINASDRIKAEWALNGLGVDIRKKQTISTKVFNILLKGVVKREGPVQGWEMINAHCIRGRHPPQGNLDSDSPRGKARLNLRMASKIKDRDKRIYMMGMTVEDRGGMWIRHKEALSGGKTGKEWMWVNKGKEKWGVKADLITYKTVLDAVVMELEKLKEEDRDDVWKEGQGEEREDGDGGDGVLEVKEMIMAGVGTGLGSIGIAGVRDEKAAEETAKKKKKELQEKWEKRNRQKRQQMLEIANLCRENMKEIGGL